MKTVGIAIDAWKLAIFKRHLDAAGYSYTEYPGITADTLVLKAKTARIGALKSVVEKAQLECKSQ